MGRKLKNLLLYINGFRKFTIMMLLIIIGISFRLFDLVSGSEFVDLLKGSAIAFFSFNGVEHLTKAVKDWLVAKKFSK